jgi:monovalent cation:proton antiporter-2 (CPA2) family protein
MDLAYLTDVIILLAAAVVAVPMARIAGLGTVPGFLIAGMIVGPSVLGLIDNREEIAHLAELGVVLLLFVIGIELKPSRLWAMRRAVFGLGTLQVAIAGLAVGMAVFLLFGVDVQAAALIGPALALSSTAFVLQLLIDQKKLASVYGRTSVAVLLLQDLAVVPLLALVSLLGAADFAIETDIGLALLEALLILGSIILGGRYLLRPVLERVARYGSPEVFTASAVLLVLGSAVLMAKIGLSMAMGAFVAGLLVADSEFRHQVVAEIQPFRGILLGLFFMSMGMSLDLAQFMTAPLMSLGLAALLMLLKIAVLWPLAMLFGHGNKTAVAVALLLAQSGEFALVLFAVAFDAGVFSDVLFQQLLIVVIISMLATPPLAILAYRLASSGNRGSEEMGGMPEISDAAKVVIVGFGRVGHRVGEVLGMRDIPYVAIDASTSVVRLQRSLGRPVFFGDARQPDVLKSLGVDEIGLMVVTVDDVRVGEQVVSTVHRMFPGLDIIARGHDMESSIRLKSLGASFSVSENLEASLALARTALSRVRGEHADNEVAIEHYRRDYYAKDRSNDAPRAPE